MALFWRLFLQNLMVNRTCIPIWCADEDKSIKNRDFSRNGNIFLKSQICPGLGLKGLTGPPTPGVMYQPPTFLQNSEL